MTNENKDFRLPWVNPITKNKWKNFLHRGFGHPSRAAVYKIVEEYLKMPEITYPLDFVEVGFGQCRDFSESFKNLHDEGKIKYVGYDITSQFVKYAKEEYPAYEFYTGGFLDLKKSSFDISFTRHVLEHQSPDLYKACLQSLLEATRKLCIITWFGPPRNEERIFWNNSEGFGNTGAYVNIYSKNTVFEIIENAGFDKEILKLKPDTSNELYLLKRKKLF